MSMVNKSNQIGRVNEKKNRDFFSNNLPFRSANGLAPYNPYGFVFPTGTEKGAVLRFTNSEDQYQDVGVTKIAAVGQSIGLQLDSRIDPIQHSIDLNSKANRGYAGGGASTISVGSNTVTFNNAALGDEVNWLTEFSTAEFGKLDATFLVENNSGGVIVYLGNSASLLTGNGLFNITNVSATTPWFIVRSNTAGLNAKLTLLNLVGYPGNHLSQATTTARPLSAIETVGTWGESVYNGRFDGIDDIVGSSTFAAGTLQNGMDLFIAYKLSTSNIVMMFDAAKTKYIAAASAAVTPASGNVGAVYSYYIDGVNVGNNTMTEAQVQAALTTAGSGWHVLEIRDLDMSTWTSVFLGYYGGGYNATENLGDVILCPAQSAANRTLIRRIVGTGVGLNF